MKLVLAIVSGDDSSKVSGALTKGGFPVTKLATTGGFLAAGNTTFLIGADDDSIPVIIDTIKSNSSTRKQLKSSAASYGVGMFSAAPLEVQVSGATIFVLGVEEFHKL